MISSIASYSAHYASFRFPAWPSLPAFWPLLYTTVDRKNKRVWRLISFLHLIPPDHLSRIKHISNDIEDKLAEDNNRLVNLDAGHLDHNKIVLASFKGAGQKIYLGNCVWADFIARYRSGRYQPFDWTFPDFKEGRYDLELSQIRDIYRKQISSIRLPRK